MATLNEAAASPYPIGGDLATHVRGQMVKHLVQRTIFCPVDGSVMDVRDVVVWLDRDGDPASVCSPTGYRRLLAERPTAVQILAAKGITVSTETLPEDLR